jgi:hypothetical protein
MRRNISGGKKGSSYALEYENTILKTSTVGDGHVQLSGLPTLLFDKHNKGQNRDGRIKPFWPSKQCLCAHHNRGVVLTTKNQFLCSLNSITSTTRGLRVQHMENELSLPLKNRYSQLALKETIFLLSYLLF